MPPPSSGGIVLAEVLGILSAKVKDPAKLARGSSAHLHLLTEALKHGFADRARLLGDPDFVEVPTAKLMDPAYHLALSARIEDRTQPPEKYGLGGGAQLPTDGGTAHLSVVDAEGNAVALTTTVNTWFGAHLLAGKTGIVLNNQMDDFAVAPNTPNAFGLVGNAQNAVAAGKRPLSSMSPTVVLEGDKVKMVVGGAGGPTIITGTLQVMLNVLDFKMDAQAASAAPRIHHQWQPNLLFYENDIPADVIEALGKRGHQTRPRPPLSGSLVNVVVRTASGLEAAAEFRSGGAPAGY
jgi:gamma-glutamyltranspeptidase/glutathione hydrolase